MKRYILGLDEGTTSLRAVLYDVGKKEIVDKASKPLQQFFPRNGWVEQDAEEIYRKVLTACREVIKQNHVKPKELLGIGITNQRETVVAWDRATGKPICHAIGWQCRRTSDMVEKLSSYEKRLIREKTGLLPNPYFSATKMKWILDNVKQAKGLLQKEQLCFGTIDSFLAFKLTKNFVTDTTNASRTMLMNLQTLDWDDELLNFFQIPRTCLPKIMPCDANFGVCKTLLKTPILSMIGDQQSSMIGQGAIDVGNSKVTFGTGGFVLTNVSSPTTTQNLLVTVARTLNGKTDYAIEGSIYSACSAINWLKEMGFYEDVNQTAEMALSLSDNGGVYFVPAFTGLGAPYWNDSARATIRGMTFETTKSHVVRACLESMAYNTKAILDEMHEIGLQMRKISVDGGGSKNDFVLQFLADMVGHDVVKSKQSEATVMGAIYVAMLSLKLISRKEIKKLTESDVVFHSKMTEKQRKKNYDGWLNAITHV